MGHPLLDQIADFIDSIPSLPVTTGETPKQLQAILGTRPLPEHGTNADALLQHAAELLFGHSLLNGHPRFMGYITSSPAPIGALADMLAAVVNPNVGANILSPMATEIEKQTVRWLAQLVGLAPSYGGLLVSGGNMANFTGFLAGRTAKAPKAFKEDGINASGQKLLIYASKATHTWIEKAAVLFGHGTNSIRWIATVGQNKMDLTVLESTIHADKEQGHQPMMVVGTAGDVSTGAVDDLQGIADICHRYGLWFHIDGAYGAPAAALPELKEIFAGMHHADSIALDPHKWLYAPLEAGCALVKDPNHLLATFSSHPEYYNFSTDEYPTLNYYEYGMQNSRGFRALKVWLTLQQAGRQGYQQMIREDIRLSKLMYDLAASHPRLQAMTQHLSITTLRYIPEGMDPDDENNTPYLNELNEALLNELQKDGRIFLSVAMIQGKYCLRGCIVNFRTSADDIAEIINVVVEIGEMVVIKRK